MFTVVSYDIVDDRRRNKVHKEMRNFGRHVQYSVFECQLDGETLKKMARRLHALIDKREDSVRIYQLCEACVGKVQVIGQGEVTKVEPFQIVG